MAGTRSTRRIGNKVPGHAGQGRAADDGEPADSGDVGGKKVRKDTRTGYLAIEPSSGGPKVYRLSRRGNRRLNHPIHMARSPRSATSTAQAAPTTTRNWPKTGKEALCALKRQLSDAEQQGKG